MSAASGKRIPHVVIVGGGAGGLELEGRRIEVDGSHRAMSADGKRLDSVYGLGDCAACFEDGATQPDGATAQVAEQQARFLARSLHAQRRNKSAGSFRYRDRGTLVSLGRRFAAGDVALLGSAKGSLNIQGWGAKLAYVALYRNHRLTLFGWWGTTLETLAGFLRRSALPSVKLKW